jgi:hypothetical protein
MRDIQRIHQLHRAFAGLNIGAAFAGLAFGTAPIDLNIILLAVLFMLLRAKFWLDDEAYLDDVGRGELPGGLPFGFGMFLAVASWIAWGFAGFYIKDLELCGLLMVVVFAVSTFWIVAAMVKRGAYAEQVPWLFFNCLYALGFILIYWRRQPWNPFSDRPSGFTTSVLVLLFLLFLTDLGVTRILEQKRQLPKADG